MLNNGVLLCEDHEADTFQPAEEDTAPPAAVEINILGKAHFGLGKITFESLGSGVIQFPKERPNMLLNGSADLENRLSLGVFANDRIYTEPNEEGEVIGDCHLRPPKQKLNGSFETFCELVYDGLEDLPAKSELFWSYGNEYWQIKKHWE